MIDFNDPHTDLHSEHGALPGEHPGRAAQPHRQGPRPGLAGIREARPGADRALRPGLRVHDGLPHRRRAPSAGQRPRSPCVLVRNGPRSRFVGPTFRAADSADVTRLAEVTGAKVEPLADTLGGRAVDAHRPQRDAGAARGRPPRAAGAARPEPAHLQLRPRTGAGQRHAAPAPPAGGGSAARSRRDPDHASTASRSTGTCSTSACSSATSCATRGSGSSGRS